MAEEYTENGKKTVKVEYKKIEEKIESPIVVSGTVKEMENYKAKTESSNSFENVQKSEIKREGKKRCWCGSGKMFEDCHGKHLRVDKNPGASAEEYEHKLNVREIDEYDSPESQKEYKENDKGEEKLEKGEKLLSLEESVKENEEGEQVNSKKYKEKE